MRLYSDENDVSLGDIPQKYPNERFDLICADCGTLMKLRESKFGQFYGCTSYPTCKGTHGARSDGKPLGKPADKTTRKSRIKAHFVFDQIWKELLPDPSYVQPTKTSPFWDRFDKSGADKMNRHKAYKWLRKAMQLSESQAHISMFTTDQCDQLIGLVYRDFPKLKDAWARLIHDDIFGEDD